ncbi:Uncharacterised protein [uncultured archaeon]|nr:Uncharacterised protein [uncultured archaeon]
MLDKKGVNKAQREIVEKLAKESGIDLVRV